MKRSVAALRAGVKSLRYIIEETVPPGPERREALALIRSAYYTGRDAILAEGAEADRLADEFYGCECNPGECTHLPPIEFRQGDEAETAPRWGHRLAFDFNVSETSPVVKGTWVTVAHVVELIVDGWSWADVLRTHPELVEDDVRACLAYTVDEHTREAA